MLIDIMFLLIIAGFLFFGAFLFKPFVLAWNNANTERNPLEDFFKIKEYKNGNIVLHNAYVSFKLQRSGLIWKLVSINIKKYSKKKLTESFGVIGLYYRYDDGITHIYDSRFDNLGVNLAYPIQIGVIKQDVIQKLSLNNYTLNYCFGIKED